MAPTTSNTVLFFVVWLLFAAVCLANKPPRASIGFTPGLQAQRRNQANGQSATAEMAYGPLVPRMNGAHNYSAALRRADPGAPGMDLYGPLLEVPGCVICPKQDIRKLTGRDLLASLTTERMQEYMRIDSPESLRNKCVFYTASVSKPNPQYLSDKASIWACEKKKLSVWHLWPNKIMAALDKYQDFYGIDVDGNWLKSINDLPTEPVDKNVPPRIQYFQNMSGAMAKMCRGEVVIMTQTPSNLRIYEDGGSQWPNIWATTERPALLELIAKGDITRVIVANYYDPDIMRAINLETFQDLGEVLPSQLQFRDLHDNETADARLLVRDACSSSGLPQRLAAGDPFADRFDLFHVQG